MNTIANLLFQARMLKETPRSGFHYLGAGKESVAEHTFCTTFIAFIMSQLCPEVDSARLVNMCLLHDLTETHTGDLNSVHKQYVSADNEKAQADTVAGLPFGDALDDLIREFEANRTLEAKLAHDADQLALVLDLKALADIGFRPPEKWLPPVIRRLQTDIGRSLAEDILKTSWDAWWFEKLG